MFFYFNIYLFMILIFLLRSTQQSSAVPWFLCSPELCSWCNFFYFHLIAYIFPPFICFPVSFIFLSPPAAKVIFFWFCFVFYAAISPFFAHSIISFLPIHFPITPLFAASGKRAVPLLYHYSLFLLVARETGSAIGVSSAYNYLRGEENCAINRDSCLWKT